MYFRVHNDNRGARLNSDDIAGIQFLYRKGSGGGGGGTGTCPADTLCLLKARFQVSVTWQNQFNGSSGVGVPIPSTDLAGFFAFTDPANIELIVKILDFGTQIKVFYSQLTNLRFTMTVRDTLTGYSKAYSNTLGDCGAIDNDFLSGFAALTDGLLDGATAAASGTCVASTTTLCTLSKRFAITVDWRNQYNGASGVGKQKTLSNLTGAFLFDDPANLEILIKTLEFPDKILVIYGSLSNFEYTIHVTDTSNGRSKNYFNPAGTFCGALDQTTF